MRRFLPLFALLVSVLSHLHITMLEARPRRPRRPSSSSYVLVAPLDVGPFPDAAPPDSGDAGVWPDAAPPDSGDAGSLVDAGALGFAYTGQSWINVSPGAAVQVPVISSAQAYGSTWSVDAGVVPLLNGTETNNEEVLVAPVHNNLRSLWEQANPGHGSPPWSAVWSAFPGASIDDLDCRTWPAGTYSPGTVCQELIDRATVAVTAGAITKIPLVFYAQGHGDLEDGTDPAVWCDRVEQFRVDLRDQFRAIPGYSDGGDDLKLLMVAEGRWSMIANQSTSPYTDGQVACAALYPEIYLGSPMTAHVDFSPVDNRHTSGPGQVQLAGAMARAGYQLVFGTGDYTPFQMQTCTLIGATTIDCDFHIPCRAYGVCQDDPPIIFDSKPGGHQAWPNSGFRIKDDAFNASITNVAIEQCDAGTNCRVRLTVDQTPQSGATIHLADESDGGAFPSRTYAGSNLRSTWTGWPDTGAAWGAGQLDDAGRPRGDDYPVPISRALGGQDAGYHPDAAPDAAVSDAGTAYANCYAVRFGGFSPNNGTTTGSLVEVGSWSTDAGPGLTDLTQWTVMMHYRHNPLSTSPQIRNVPFNQGCPGCGNNELFVAKFEPGVSGRLSIYWDGSGPSASGSPMTHTAMSHNVEAQLVVVYDGTAADTLGGGSDPRARVYRWLAGETGGLADLGSVEDWGGPTGGSVMPTAMGTTDRPFVFGGGYGGTLPDLDGDVYSIAVWRTALAPAEVAALNSGAAVVDPLNLATQPDLYFPIEAERPGDTTLADLIGSATGTLQPAYTLSDGGLGAPVDGSIPQVVATGLCP